MSVKKLSHEDYTVGWICPLEVEQIAALEMLDKEHERLPQLPTDHNVYNLGSIGGHNVVIAALYQAGNNPAATVVTQMRMTFPNLRFGLLVGIGGGVPVKTDNGIIRLGDVVVSKPAGDHSGAVQYDHGKAETGQFRRTGALAPPPAVLLCAAQDLGAKRARSRKDPVLENLKRTDLKIRGLRKYGHPGPAQDHLYKPDYIHLDAKLSCDKCGCDSNQRVPRGGDDDDEDDDSPHVVVHRGTIASGELVIKNGILRDQLAEQYGILCFEMEAAGALADFPCIVIRGISDYSDSHKNNQWHGYAAAVAAGYSRELFFHMPVDEVKRYISSATEDGVKHLVNARHDQERQKIADWLTPIDYAPQQSDFISRRQKGTGQWLSNSSEFQRWLKTSNQTLFCPGIPGAGKTMISSIVVDHLTTVFKDDASTGVAYIYCNYQPQQVQTPEDLLSSLLKQLVQDQPVPPDIKSLYERHTTNRSRPSLDEIAKAFRSTVQLYSRMFIIIDALDEYYVSNNEGQKRLLLEIFSLQKQAYVNLFATSRFISEIMSQFEGCLWKEIRAQDDDILSYVNGRIPQLLRSNISKYPEYPDLQHTIRSDMVKAVDGMFLLARLHMDSLMSQPTLGHIKQAMRSLPQGIKGLDETYEKAMKRIESQEEGYRDLAKQVLSWITYAKRALSTSEIRHALAVKADMTDMDKDFLPEVEILGSVCAGLVALDEKSDIIRLVHYTTREYFERTSSFPNAETDIAVSCVNYLSFNVFGTGLCPTDAELKTRLKLNPLYDYAAKNWGHHARTASTDTRQLNLRFFESEAKVSACRQVTVTMSYSDYIQKEPRRTTGAHLAAYFGLRELIITLLEKEYCPDLKDENGRTPLSWAAENGHEAVVRLLIERDDVEADSRDKNGRTPLSRVAQIGHEAVVRLLAERDDVEADSRDKNGQTPLLWAAGNGREAVFRLLIERADVEADSRDKNGRTPLSRAAQIGHEAVVRLLVERDDVEADSRDKNGQTPLSWAAGNGHEAVVRLLIERDDVEADSRDEYYGQTPLSRAAQMRHEAVVRLLVKRADVEADSKDKNGQTPLSWAAWNGHEAVVRLLVERADVEADSKDKNGQTPLSWAARNGREAIVRLLVERADVEADLRDEKGQTPLSWAAWNGHEAVVRLLIERVDVEADSRDENGQTPLSWAARNGREAIVRLLVERDDVEADSRDEYDGQTPLSWAAMNGHEAVVKLLVERADVEADSRDKNGQTPLSYAAEDGHEAVVSLLLTKDEVNPDSKDKNGRTPLSWAAGANRRLVYNQNFEGVVQLLLTNDRVDVNSKDTNDRTPLSLAAEVGHVERVKLLLAKDGINRDIKDNDGRTPLWWAEKNGHQDVINIITSSS